MAGTVLTRASLTFGRHLLRHGEGGLLPQWPSPVGAGRSAGSVMPCPSAELPLFVSSWFSASLLLVGRLVGGSVSASTHGPHNSEGVLAILAIGLTRVSRGRLLAKKVQPCSFSLLCLTLADVVWLGNGHSTWILARWVMTC
jgi:hypothetical protein